MYEFTYEFTTLAPPPPELQRLLAAMYGNQEAMDGFARVNAGVTSPAAFRRKRRTDREGRYFMPSRRRDLLYRLNLRSFTARPTHRPWSSP
jgi:hypothetical protein